jgi:hypothetical protein
MNRLRLEYRIDRHPYWPDSVWTALFVDGQEITSREWPSVIDLTQLRRSAGEDGEFFIFTCECGDAGCAGIDEPVSVTRDADGIRWQLGDAWRFIGVSPDEGRDWEEQSAGANGGAVAGVPRDFLFSAEQYAAAVEQDVSSGQAFVARLDRFITITPDSNLAVLKFPDLDPAEASRRQSDALGAWRVEHPLPPGPARWGRISRS